MTKHFRTPWNKGRAVGQKKPFTPKQIRLLKDILSNNNLRELSLLSLAIDTMLRASDLLNLLVEDISDHKGNIKSEFTLKQKKTKESHIVIISDETKKYLTEYIKSSNKYEDDYLFATRNKKDKPITVRWYSEIVKSWTRLLNLDHKLYSTHSLRRTRASYIFKKTNNIEIVKQLLGQKSVNSTSAYLNISKQEALDIGKEYLI